MDELTDNPYCERCHEELATTTVEEATGPNSTQTINVCQNCKEKDDNYDGPGDAYYYDVESFYSAEEQFRIQRDLKR